MELILANFAGTIREDTFNGRKYLVVPLTMIVHGVLSGSNGPLYYPQEELADAEIWNHMPIVVRHPYRHGKPTSARNPDILNKTGIGFVFEAKPSLNGGALTAEGWVDIEAAKRVDPGLYNDLAAGRQIELSTGLRADYEKAPAGASFNGKPYRYIVRNMKPDHLAFLPDQVGACSLDMGCGVHVTTNSAETVTEIVDELPKDYLANLKEGEGFEIIFNGVKKQFKLTRLKPTLNEEELKSTFWHKLGAMLGVTNGKPPVKDEVQSGSSTNNNEEPDMAKLTESDRPKLIKELTANCDCWDAKADAEALKVLPLSKLAQLVNHAKEEADARELVESVKEGITDTAGAKLSFNSETGKWEAELPEKPKGKRKATTNTQDDEDEPEETQNSRLTPEEIEDLKFARTQRSKMRQNLITKLVANFEPDSRAERSKKLMKKSIDELQELLEFATVNAGPGDDEDDDDDEDYPPVRNRRRKPGPYAGAGRVANSKDDDDDDMTNNLLIPPSLEFNGDHATELRKRLEAARSAS